ncbi:MAG: hypothetical protein ACR2L2_18110 [Acidobacteriota bacterium]
MEPEDSVRVIRWEKESVSGEVYDDLLSRYEKILVFAGQLQEKNRQQLLLQEKSEAIEKENEDLRRHMAVDESYVRLLESALASLGVLKQGASDQ